MVRQLPSVTLKSGETAEIFKVTGPEPEWEERLLSRLSHKGRLWDRPMQQALRGGLPGMKMHFYQMRLDDHAVGNITVVEALERPVALLQHVFTDPEHRRKGICNHLMTLVTDDFVAAGGRAMYLGTEYEGPAFRIYQEFGFRAIGEGGAMVWAPDDGYPDSFFVQGPVQVRPAQWGDWPLLTALYQREEGWDLRGYILGHFGHSSYESAFCRVEELIDAGKAEQSTVLQIEETGAVAGHAFLGKDEKWPDGPWVLDFFVHPLFTERTGELLQAIEFPAGRKVQAYCDEAAEDRAEALRGAGFSLEATLRGQYSTKDGRLVDVHVYARQG